MCRLAVFATTLQFLLYLYLQLFLSELCHHSFLDSLHHSTLHSFQCLPLASFKHKISTRMTLDMSIQIAFMLRTLITNWTVQVYGPRRCVGGPRRRSGGPRRQGSGPRRRSGGPRRRGGL